MSRSCWIVAIVFLTGCTFYPDTTQHSFQIIEENGVPVALTTGGPKYTDELFTYEKVMVLDTDQSEETLLYRPTQFMADDAGNMYINDQGIGSILVFDATGRYSHLIGRMGSGPGESIYGQIQLIHDGIIQFYGIKERRTTRFNPDGTIVDITTMPPRIDLLGNTGFIILPDYRQVILTNETEISDNEAEKNLKSASGGNQRWGAIILSTDGEKIAEVHTPWIRISEMMDVNVGGTTYASPIQIAFGPLPTAIYHHTHGIVLSLSEQPILAIYDPAGRKTRMIRIELDPEPVTAADISRVRQTLLENNEQSEKPMDWQSFADHYPFADEKALWGRIEIDAEGYFWLDLSLPPETEEGNIHSYMVLSPEGEYLGTTSRPYDPSASMSGGRLYILEEDRETGEILPTVYRINPAVRGLQYPN